MTIRSIQFYTDLAVLTFREQIRSNWFQFIFGLSILIFGCALLIAKLDTSLALVTGQYLFQGCFDFLSFALVMMLSMYAFPKTLQQKFFEDWGSLGYPVEFLLLARLSGYSVYLAFLQLILFVIIYVSTHIVFHRGLLLDPSSLPTFQILLIWGIVLSLLFSEPLALFLLGGLIFISQTSGSLMGALQGHFFGIPSALINLFPSPWPSVTILQDHPIYFFLSFIQWVWVVLFSCLILARRYPKLSYFS